MPANRAQAAFGGGFGYAVATLAASGEPSAISYGSGMTETIGRNARGQVTSVVAQLGATTLLSLTNEFETSTNNGNLKSQTMLPLEIKQTFGYDNRNRLSSASEQPSGGGAVTWSQGFGYDDFGNQWVGSQTGSLPGGGPRPNGAMWYQSGSPAVISNRVAGLSYDAAGNLLTLGGLTAVYDGESRLKGVTSGAFGYDYDAFGRRVRTVANGKTTYFVYDAMGRLTAEYQAGQTAATQKQYLVQDQLGSTRLVTDSAGGVVRRADYLPYGEEIPSAVGGRTLAGYGLDAGVRQAFTSQIRDGETGWDYFGARYFSGALGRFTGPDLPLFDQSPSDPLSWNLYAYVRNNPLRSIDPTGRGCVSAMGEIGGEGPRNTNVPTVPGPSCEEIDKADQGLKPTVTVTEKGSGHVVGLTQFSDFVAGAGDSISFGLTNLVRFVLPGGDSTDKCSESYEAGEWAGVAVSAGMGGAAGFAKSGLKSLGKEFSHFVPNRMGGARAWWNGNFVSAIRHYKHDPYRRLNRAAEQAAGPKYPPSLAQLDRVPDTFKSAGAGGAGAAMGNAARGGCAPK